MGGSRRGDSCCFEGETVTIPPAVCTFPVPALVNTESLCCNGRVVALEWSPPWGLSWSREAREKSPEMRGVSLRQICRGRPKGEGRLWIQTREGRLDDASLALVVHQGQLETDPCHATAPWIHTVWPSLDSFIFRKSYSKIHYPSNSCQSFDPLQPLLHSLFNRCHQCFRSQEERHLLEKLFSLDSIEADGL